MILVIGGLASGKRDYVKKEFGFTDADMADAALDGRPVVYNLQNLVTASLSSVDGLLPALLLKKVVICNEVGSGVVPIDKTERGAREATGRLCVGLAEKAEKVIRICCGIPSVIKG
ncbi:adenosylcobinamide kinase /adenosylcobinamide-phosphate guanylyltransferase [Sporobacter termitidis DSM 10068]|uniref:Adenosylcobinamide kinase /adenosylcobinamide-phosphate guanylyltransferase n=1 Tax=Sporobacter termitidis DSM 10068 TaxID=1123282 RepID=A0A1M5X547_9FIRM|nr:bifunctional adenosylcobinamide kinase/adenosylcobinamide-phosphate guanylyltransferase [Sporobacter termitidis]SHH94333.1 adenosylcobinamide kinase /adenosylcobinamide-phosphate guanylyltransferase [Sporobacter termitidis DSM 10068]